MSAQPRPLVLAFLAFLPGLLAGLRYTPNISPLLIAACCSMAVAWGLGRSRLRHRRTATWSVLVAALACAGAARGSFAGAKVDADCRASIPDGATVSVRGALGASHISLGEDPFAAPPLLPVSAHEIRRLPGRSGCSGEVRVRFPRGGAEVQAGAEVELIGHWVRYSEPVVHSDWPRDPRYRGFLAIDSIVSVEPPRFGRHPLLMLRGRTELHLRNVFPRHGALAEALVLGRREYVDSAVRDRFTRAGLAHLLAISGMHVGLIAGMLLLVGGSLPVPRRHLAWGMIGCIWLYLAIIGAPSSAVRAGVMISLGLAGVALQRPFAAMPVVAAAAFAILIHNPLAVLEPGFQLSFAGVFGILAVRGVALRQLPQRWRNRAPVRAVFEALVISGAAFLATAPITAYFFGSIAPAALVANLPAVPLMSLALAGIILASVVEPFIPLLGSLIADGSGLALDLLDRVAAFAAMLPYGHLGVPRPALGTWCAAALILLLVLDLAGRLRPRVRWTAAGMTVAAFALVIPVGVAAREAPVEVHFLDVGQGDAIAVRTPHRQWILIDAGPRYEDYDAGERRVLPFLRAHGAWRLEAVVLTHPDGDHMGGIPAVIEGIEVGRLIDPGFITGKAIYLETLRAARRRGVDWVRASAGATLSLDGVVLDFLWPNAETLDHAEDANEISAVVRLRYSGVAILLMGDAPAEREEALVRRHGTALRADILKAGHHGSAASTTETLLDAVDPDLVVISAGRRNRHGHPAPEVLRRLRKRGIEIARTDRDGTVSIRLHPDGDGRRWRVQQ